jgi:ubiquinone/menaquinone biosynthesis C-methylase UbiE
LQGDCSNGATGQANVSVGRCRPRDRGTAGSVGAREPPDQTEEIAITGIAPDTDRLNEFLGRFVGDLAATAAAGNVVVGHRLGLYAALAHGPATGVDLADRTGCAARPVIEWLRGQAAGGYVEYDPATERYSMTVEQAFCLADPDGAFYLPGAFLLALGALRAEGRITESFRTGAGVGWHEHHEDVFLGCEAFFRPGYVANVVSSWIPALRGVKDTLVAGGRIADIGCGLGSSAVIMAEAYPRIRVAGSDYHDASIELARKRAADAGVADRVTFEVASAQTFSGTGYDLVTSFDCLHDMGDPPAAARHVREALAPDGTWMVVEPLSGDHVEDNLHPVGRMYYNFSTFLCVPNGLSQPGGYALGSQAGEAQIRRVMTDAGFTRFRRAAQTPFNVVFEVRP